MKHALLALLCLLLGLSAARAQEPAPPVEKTYALGPGAKLTVFIPATPHFGNAKPMMLFIPGGGWLQSDIAPVLPFCRYFAAQGYITAAVSYRIVPPYPPDPTLNIADGRYGTWPAALNDVRAAIWQMRREAKSWGGEASSVAAVGFSAGGMLAAHLGVRDEADPIDGLSGKAQRVVSVGGPWDLRAVLTSFKAHGWDVTPGKNQDYPDPSGLGMVMTLFGGRPDTVMNGTKPSPDEAWAASPLKYVSADIAPTLMLHGSRDRLVPPAQAQAAFTACEAAAPGRCHLKLFDAGHEVTEDFMQPMISFLSVE